MSRDYIKLFQKLGDRTGFNRSKRNLHSVINKIREYISVYIQSYSNNIRIVDRMPIHICKFGRAHFSKCFKGEASYGRCPSLMIGIHQRNKLILDLSFMHLLQ